MSGAGIIEGARFATPSPAKVRDNIATRVGWNIRDLTATTDINALARSWGYDDAENWFEVTDRWMRNHKMDALERPTFLLKAPKVDADAPTEKQHAFLNSLRVERGQAPVDYDTLCDLMDRRGVSAEIDRLLKTPKVAAKPVEHSFKRVELEDGVYLHEDNVYKVVHAQGGSNRQYAKRLTVTDGQGRFEYEQGAIAKIKPEEKMTLAQAAQYGALYGCCANCGRALSNEDSIEAGIGPVCRDRFAA